MICTLSLMTEKSIILTRAHLVIPGLRPCCRTGAGMGHSSCCTRAVIIPRMTESFFKCDECQAQGTSETHAYWCSQYKGKKEGK